MSETSIEKGHEEVFKDIVLDWRALKSKRQKRRKFKDYQELLLKEIPGAADRTNVAMHAVIDVTSAAGENQTRGMGANTVIRNQALIHYIARLASSNNDDDEFDFSFVESLLANGADINTADKYGQTMFHEVARSWNVDVARFLLNRGANINQQDKYGRAPLHVAAAVDYTEMIEFLLQHKADIDITTFGELQTPIHFAAKNDACQALKLFINYGANINCRDYQNRTPIQVAASMSRTKAARYLVELGTPTGVYDHNGEMTLSLLILKMPEVATLALDQFRSQDMINRKEYNFLNYIEGPRILEDGLRENKARSPLEVAIQYEQYCIVMHPVMKRLINVKWEYFGKKGARNDLIMNVVFAFVWTVLSISLPLRADQLYLPLKYHWWRLLFAIAGVFLTVLECYKQVTSFVYMNKAIRRWKAFREKTLLNDKRFCHPKWRDENEYLEKEIKGAREERFFTRQDGWIIIDWIALLLIVSGVASHISFLVIGSKLSRDVHIRIVSFILIVLYVRLLKFARPFEGPGPFVASIAPMLKDFLKWSVLFCLLFIPYASIFWMIFGPTNEKSAPVLSDIPGLIFTVFSMAAYGNLSIVEELVNIDKNMARLLVGSFVAISTVVTLNLLIAMLADTFTRMYENSVETATMQRAKTILYLEQKLSSTVWRQYCEYIQKECSPEVCSFSEDMTVGRRDKKRKKEKLLRNIEEIHTVINDRLGPKVGTEKSDMDQLLEGVNNLNRRLDSFKTRLQQHSGSRLTSRGSINLNIIVEPREGNNPFLNGVVLKSEELSDKKTQSGPNHKSNELSEISQVNVKRLKNVDITSSASPSSPWDTGNEEGLTNQKIQKQLEVILNLMKEAIKNGKLNFTMNGKALLTEEKESVENLVKAENNSVQNSSDSLQGTVYASSNHVIMNPTCSSVLCPEGDDARPSSPDLYTSDEVTVRTPVGSPDDERSVDQVSAERLNARYDGSSFLSTSSEGNVTCDDINGFAEMSSSQTSVFSNTSERRSSPNEAGQVSRRSYRRVHRPKTLSFYASGSSYGGSSEFDVNNHQVEKNVKNNEENPVDRVVFEDDFSSSSQGTASTDPSCQYEDDDSQTSSVSRSVGTAEVFFSTSPEGDGLTARSSKDVSRVPHVRWADTASDACNVPFLNIREISASPSDHFSGDVRLESDTASGDEGQSGSERNTRQQTDV